MLTFDGGVYTMVLPLRLSGTINISGFPVVDVYAGQIVDTAANGFTIAARRLSQRLRQAQ